MRREGMEGRHGREGERGLRMRRARLRLGQQGLPLLQQETEEELLRLRM